MDVIHCGGVDPGIVHTGCVSLLIYPQRKLLEVRHAALLGMAGGPVKDFFYGNGQPPLPQLWIEEYRPRSNLNSDKRMVEGVRAIREATGGTVLLNHGVLKIIKPELMKVMGLWKFSTVTHHQDLRSAARIMLLGMVKDEYLNRVISRIVRDHLNGNTWSVEQC